MRSTTDYPFLIYKMNSNIPVVSTYAPYESKNGMLTKIWGPPMWHTLHTISFNYPTIPTPADKKRYRDFILQLKYVLPCGKCRTNLKHNFAKLPLHMSHMASRDSFSRYIYALHECVNTMLGKHSGLTYEQVRDRYEAFRANCPSTLNTSTLSNRSSQTKKKSKETGCTEPLYRIKSRCIMNIIPDNKRTRKQPSITIHTRCACVKTHATPVT